MRARVRGYFLRLRLKLFDCTSADVIFPRKGYPGFDPLSPVSNGEAHCPLHLLCRSALEPLLLATNLRRTNTVRDIFNIERFALVKGETVAIVGPNGAGKTTLLMTLALLQPPDSGTIALNGITAAPDNLIQLRRRMAVVFQDSLLLDMSVLANLMTALRIRNVPRPQALDRAHKWLGVFGVDALASRPAGALSGGEAQRVSLARAFSLEPDLLFLDEPFAALDYPTRNSLLRDFGPILKSMNLTTLFVTHDYTEIPFLAEKTAVMYEGRIIKFGPNAEIFGEDFLERKAWIPWADHAGQA